MGVYEELLAKLGLLHLKDDPEKLQEAILKELGLSDLKGDHEAMMKKAGEILDEKQKEFNEVKSDLGELLQKHTMKRHN